MSESWSTNQTNANLNEITKSKSSKIAFYVLVFLSLFTLLFFILAIIFKLSTNQEIVDENISLVQDQNNSSESPETPEQKYLSLISNQQQEFKFTDEEALELGYLVCNSFSDGQTPTEIKSVIEETLGGDAKAVEAANESAKIAVTTLCADFSEYSNEFELNIIKENEISSDSLCDSNYSGACVPIVPYDLDCPDIGQLVLVVGVDIHKFDRDRDGRACES